MSERELMDELRELSRGYAEAGPEERDRRRAAAIAAAEREAAREGGEEAHSSKGGYASRAAHQPGPAATERDEAEVSRRHAEMSAAERAATAAIGAPPPVHYCHEDGRIACSESDGDVEAWTGDAHAVSCAPCRMETNHLRGAQPAFAFPAESDQAKLAAAIEQAARIVELIDEARDVEPHDRPAAAQALAAAIAATRELPDLHELHAVGAFPTPAEFAEQLAGAGSPEELARIAADLRSAVAGE